MTDREKIARIFFSFDHSSNPETDDDFWATFNPLYKEKDYRYADEVLALLKPKMLTPEEAKVLAHCFASGQGRVFSAAKWETCLYAKLLKISEGQ